MRVCVVGAGLAGLAAAWALEQSAVEPLVLEARQRVGGRVHSEQLPNGAIIERGAEFIEHDQPEIAATARALALTLAPAGMSYGRRDPRGVEPLPAGLLEREIERLGALVAGRDGLEDVSAADVLAALDLDPRARAVIAARVQISAAQPLDELAGTALLHGGSTFAPDESFHVAGGNQRLAVRMAEELGDAVRLGVAVESVAWEPGSGRRIDAGPGDAAQGPAVRVRAGGDVVEADACVVTVPASVVGRIRFDPPLPAWKSGAHARVAYGHAAKLFVPLRSPTGPSAVMSVPDHYWTWTHRARDGAVQAVVSAFAGSAPALDVLEPSAGPSRWLAAVNALRTDLDLDDAGAVVSTWDDDPWVGAAYSTRLPGRAQADDELLERALPPLYFAGEHTAGDWVGLMEGALRSGRRAALQVLGRHP